MLSDGKELFYAKKYSRIGINTDDDLPLNKPLKFPMLTIIIRCIFQEGTKLYPQIYLDECVCMSYKNVSEEIDINKTSKSKECMLCHCLYFKDLGYKFLCSINDGL